MNQPDQPRKNYPSQPKRPRQASASRRRNTPRTVAAQRLDPARRVAWQLLRAVDEDDAYANLALPHLIRAEKKRAMSERDAALATELSYGTLRLQGRYDAILAACIDRDYAEVDPGVRDALRLGAHQLLATRIPPHAAVAATVDLVRAEIGSGAAGFVNAVLRRVAEHDLEAWLERVTKQLSPDDALAVRHSHPAWIVRALRDALARRGRDVGELSDLLQADNTAPVLTLAALPGLSEPGELGEPFGPSPFAVRATGDPGDISAVRQGRARVQDAGSQAVTYALAQAPLNGPDAGAWLDMCAGPGGKSALLGALLRQAREAGELPPDARLHAVEVSDHRTALVRQSVAGVNAAQPTPVVQVHHGDSRDAEFLSQLNTATISASGFDRVLVDAPCSGLGALRRRPESRWRRRPGDLAQLGVLQRELLTSALEVVRPGGVVGYVTCSPHVAETDVVVQDVLRRRDDVALISEPQQLWPHIDATDAMFLALIQRQ